MMRTFQQQRNYEQLELLPPQIGELASLGLRQIWQTFSEFWQPSKEPRIRQKTDRNGKLYWQIYDPLNDCMLHFDDEQSVMIWLEEQHYRRFRHVYGT